MRGTEVRLGTIVVAIVLLLGGLCLLAIYANPSRSPTGPQLPSTSLPILFGPPGPNYVGTWIWYNFTLTSAQPNVTWSLLNFTVIPGPLTKSALNWSLNALDPSSGVAATYSDHAGNWTTTSAAPALAGDVLVLRTDSSLTLGAFGVTWTAFGGGGYSVGPL